MMVGGQQSMTSPIVSLLFIDNDHSNVGDKYCPDIKGNKMCPSTMCTAQAFVLCHCTNRLKDDYYEEKLT